MVFSISVEGCLLISSRVKFTDMYTDENTDDDDDDDDDNVAVDVSRYRYCVNKLKIISDYYSTSTSITTLYIYLR